MSGAAEGAGEAGARFVLVAFDGAHCDRIRKSLGVRLRFPAILDHLVPPGPVVRPVYYRDLRDETEVERQEGLLRYLDRKGFELHGAMPSEMGPGPRERCGTNLVELAVDALEASHGAERVVLVAGDRKLVSLVRAIRQGGVFVTLATALAIPEAVRASADLMAEADDVVDLTELLLSPDGGGS